MIIFRIFITHAKSPDSVKVSDEVSFRIEQRRRIGGDNNGVDLTDSFQSTP